jgi:uncharacterized delta-60 repeat protein
MISRFLSQMKSQWVARALQGVAFLTLIAIVFSVAMPASGLDLVRDPNFAVDGDKPGVYASGVTSIGPGQHYAGLDGPGTHLFFYDRARAAAFQTVDDEQKILQVGFTTDLPRTTTTFTPRNTIVLARYNLDGTLDQNYATCAAPGAPAGNPTGNGMLRVNPDSAMNERALALYVSPDGQTVYVGGAVMEKVGTGQFERFMLLKIEPNGTLKLDPLCDQSTGRTTNVNKVGLDENFGNKPAGMLMSRYNISSASTIVKVHSVIFDIDVYPADFLEENLRGYIVAAGEARGVNNNLDFAVARYKPDGTLDTTFGDLDPAFTDGTRKGFTFIKVRANGSTDQADYARAVVIDKDGKILIAGYADHTYQKINFKNTLTRRTFSVVRLNPDGTRDTSFGTNGIFSYFVGHVNGIVTAGAQDVGTVKMQLWYHNSDDPNDYKIYVAGATTANQYNTHFNFGVARLNKTGMLDTTFVHNTPPTGTLQPVGTANIDMGDGKLDAAQSLYVDSDGKVVIGGYARGATNDDLAMARLLLDGQFDSSFNGNGRYVSHLTANNSGVEYVTSLLVHPDNPDEIYALGYLTQPNMNAANCGSAFATYPCYDFYAARYVLNSRPVANHDNYLSGGVEDTPFIISDPDLGVLKNDTDVEGDSMEAVGASSAQGTVSLNPDGTFTFTPNAHLNGNLTFTYYAKDPYEQSREPATVTIYFQPVNDPPTAVADAYSVAEDQTLTVTAANGVLKNDSDVDGDSITAFKLDDPANGTVTVNANGSFVYTPAPDFFGTDTFTYRAFDGELYSAPATVTITVTPVPDPPVGVADTFAAIEDTALVVAIPGVMANDYDPDQLPIGNITGLTVERVTTSPASPANGTLTLNANGSFTYTPKLNFFGTDNFSYRVKDATGRYSQTTVVTLNVAPVNDAPVITQGASVSVTMDEDNAPLAFALTLTATDIDHTGDDLTWSIASQGSNGSASVSGTGASKSISYTPTLDYYGTDSFVVRVTDSGVHGGDELSDDIIVNVTIRSVNDAPRFVVSADPGASVQASPVTTEMSEDGFDISDNADPFVLTLFATDVDVEDNDDSIVWNIATQAAHGTAAVSGTGGSKTISYTSQADYHGFDSFEVSVTDTHGATRTMLVNVTVKPVNDAGPIITEGESVNVTMSEDNAPTPFSLTLNATDFDNDTLTWSILTPAANGTAVATGTGNAKAIQYTPNLDYYGADSFVVQVSDGNNTCSVRTPVVPAPTNCGPDTITVNVTIEPVNDAPRFMEMSPQTVSMSEDELDALGDSDPFALTLNAFDVDNDDAEIEWSVATQAAYGLASVAFPATGDNLAISYVPEADFYGQDSFILQIEDAEGAFTRLTVNVTIKPVNDAAPEIDDAFPDTIVITPVDDPLAYPDQTKQVTVVMAEDGAYYDPDLDEILPYPFSLTLFASDFDDDPLIWNILVPPAHGTASLAGDGSGNSVVIDYEPTLDFNGVDWMVIRVEDGTQYRQVYGVDDYTLDDTIVVKIVVLAQDDPPVITEGSSIIVTMTEDMPETFSLTLNATDGDLDPANPDHDVVLSWSITEPPKFGTASLLTSPPLGYAVDVAYEPFENYHSLHPDHMADKFVIRVTDGQFSDYITVYVKILPVQDGLPVIEGKDTPPVLSVKVGSFTKIILRASDELDIAYDPNKTEDNIILNASDILRWSLATQPQHGNVTLSRMANGEVMLTYVPTKKAVLTDIFTIRVRDANGGEDTIQVTVRLYTTTPPKP